MAYELRDGQGSLFRNERKDRENSPDYTGTIKVNGQEFYMSAWLKEGNGKKFFSISLKPKDAPQRSQGNQSSGRQEPQQSFERDIDDDVPW